jgi:uncharacterized membrane protein
MLNKSLSIVLVLAIIGAIGAIVYFTTTHKSGDAFTEFYLLGPGGKAENFPEKLIVGEKGKVIVGIVNHEHKQTSYWVQILIDSHKNNETGPILLNDGEKWENTMAFIPNQASDNQTVEFLLFKGKETEPPTDSLYLLINITK